MFSVGDSVSDDGLEEGLKDATSFFVDHWEEYVSVMVRGFRLATY